VSTQTTGHYYYFSSEPEECFEVDTNEDDETDPDGIPSTAGQTTDYIKLVFVASLPTMQH
jgi:hypothetical protein